jgi:DNA-binding winged helix-turn-helix (wHTH) protein/pimeloyl-ACP methyl ester carboxylesterase
MILSFAECEIDLDRRELRQAGRPVHVEPQVFDLLVYLIANRERVVSKDEILDAVWGGRTVSEATLSSRINAARQAVSDSGHAQALIRTLPRRGFRFVGAIEVREDAPAPAHPAQAPAREAASRQNVTFCKTDDQVRLAVATVGKGDVLVKTANWLNHVEYDWQSPLWAPTFARLAAGRRLVRYDQRGTGLSDWEVADISFEAFVRDLESVVTAARLTRFALFGISQGASVAIAFAARHPERVSRLILHGGYALGRNKRETPADREQATAYLTLIRHGWGYRNSAFMQAFSSLYLPGGTPEQVKWFSDLQRATASPENAIRIRNACDDIDVVDLLLKVRSPTLVMHSRHDSVVPFDHGRLIASSIAGARFVGLDSNNHVILPQEPAWQQFIGEIDQFLASPPAADKRRSL